MPKKANARRYAQAVFELALEKNELEKWQADLETIAGAVGDSTVLSALENPRLSIGDKTRLLSDNLGEIGPLALNLVRLLITRTGIGMVPQIAAEYGRLLDNYRGVQSADVITAVPLDDTDKERLAGNLSALVGVDVMVKSEVDPEILGGIVARVGGKLLDGSTRSKLAALRRQMGGTEAKR